MSEIAEIRREAELWVANDEFIAPPLKALRRLLDIAEVMERNLEVRTEHHDALQRDLADATKEARQHRTVAAQAHKDTAEQVRAAVNAVKDRHEARYAQISVVLGEEVFDRAADYLRPDMHEAYKDALARARALVGAQWL